MANLTPSEVTQLVSKLKKNPYLVSVVKGGTISGSAITGGTATELNPLASAPSVDGDVETNDVTLYETEAEVQARYLTRNDLTVSITTRNISDGMELAGKNKKGDNVLASTSEYAMCFVPITAATGEPNILFPHVYVAPGFTLTPGENGEPTTITLTFNCKADSTTGVPFVFAAPAS